MISSTGPTEAQRILAKKKWGLFDKSLTFIRGNENWVYEVDHLIFRFTEKTHRDSNELQAELDWIVYLAELGLSVSTPLKSKDNRFIEEVSETWNCVVFKKAPGHLLKEAPHFTKNIFHLWGKMTGAMHKASKLYSPREHRRRHWDKDDGFILSQQGLKTTDPSHPMSILFTDLLNQMNTYEKNPDSYGLIHGDFHHGNFHYDSAEKNITLFDFDDSNYFWYAFDLAVPFASLELSKSLGRIDLDSTALRPHFMEAYHKEYNLDSFWLKQIPFFMKYRFASLYFWSKGRFLNNRLPDNKDTINFMNICEKLALET